MENCKNFITNFDNFKDFHWDSDTSSSDKFFLPWCFVRRPTFCYTRWIVLHHNALSLRPGFTQGGAFHFLSFYPSPSHHWSLGALMQALWVSGVLCNMRYQSEIHHKLKSHEISFINNICFICLVFLKFCTKHSSDAVKLCARFQDDWIIWTDVMHKRDSTRFEFKMSFLWMDIPYSTAQLGLILPMVLHS